MVSCKKHTSPVLSVIFFGQRRLHSSERSEPPEQAKRASVVALETTHDTNENTEQNTCWTTAYNNCEKLHIGDSKMET